MLKRTTDEVRKHFAEYGCELLDEYQGAMIPMIYRCKCGQMAKISWNNFTKGKRCKACGISKKTKIKEPKQRVFKENGLKRTTEEVRTYFAEQGCELQDEYRGAMVPMVYKCKCGQMAKTSWNNFTKGKRCGYCHSTGRKKKYTFEEVKNIFSSQGCTLLASSYAHSQEKLPCLCKCGRPWSVSLAVVMKGVKCYECGLEKIRRKADATREENKAYRKLYYRYKKSLKRTLEAIGLNKMDYSHKLLGYTARELKEHIENHPNWPKVKNKNWHLDHIFPIKAFADYGISDVKLINALDNLQPLTQKKNNQKCDFYIKKDFEAWLATYS